MLSKFSCSFFYSHGRAGVDKPRGAGKQERHRLRTGESWPLALVLLAWMIDSLCSAASLCLELGSVRIQIEYNILASFEISKGRTFFDLNDIQRTQSIRSLFPFRNGKQKENLNSAWSLSNRKGSNGLVNLAKSIWRIEFGELNLAN